MARRCVLQLGAWGLWTQLDRNLEATTCHLCFWKLMCNCFNCVHGGHCHPWTLNHRMSGRSCAHHSALCNQGAQTKTTKPIRRTPSAKQFWHFSRQGTTDNKWMFLLFAQVSAMCHQPANPWQASHAKIQMSRHGTRNIALGMGQLRNQWTTNNHTSHQTSS